MAPFQIKYWERRHCLFRTIDLFDMFWPIRQFSIVIHKNMCNFTEWKEHMRCTLWRNVSYMYLWIYNLFGLFKTGFSDCLSNPHVFCWGLSGKLQNSVHFHVLQVLLWMLTSHSLTNADTYCQVFEHFSSIIGITYQISFCFWFRKDIRRVAVEIYLKKPVCTEQADS